MRNKITPLVFGISMGLTPVAHVSADINDEMNSIFGEVGSMANVTSPQAFNTQSRGGIGFGGVQMRNKIVDQNVVSWVPPSAKAGCGGLDLNAGSFSFINSDQIVETLRAVAANAKGYAFQLALDAVYPESANWIETFQKKIQDMNQYLGNSCQMARGLIDGGLDAADAAKKNEEGVMAAMKNGASDFFGGLTDWSSEDSATNPVVADSFKENRGNLVFKALKKGDAKSSFKYGDTALLEQLMSITGWLSLGTTTIDPKISVSTSGSVPGEEKVLPKSEGEPKLTLRDFVYGNSGNLEVTVYECDSADLCEAPTTKNLPNFKGFDEMVREVLLGTGTNPGVIDKYLSNVGSLTDSEKAVMLNLPESQGTFIRNLAIRDPGAARNFAEAASTGLAIELAYALTKSAFDVVQASLGAVDSPYLTPFATKLATRRQEVRAEYRDLLNQKGANAAQLMRNYQVLIDNTRPVRYIEFNAAVADK